MNWGKEYKDRNSIRVQTKKEVNCLHRFLKTFKEWPVVGCFLLLRCTGDSNLYPW